MLSSLPMLKQGLKDLLKDNSANAVVVTAFSMLSMIGGVGIATDTIQWTLWKRQLQRMSDSAAVAGAFAAARGNSGTGAAAKAAAAKAAATAELNRYNLITLTGDPNDRIHSPADSGPYTGDPNAVRVVLESSRALPFSSILMSATPTISAQATAAAVGFGEYCVVALESTDKTGITFQGSSNVTLGCGVATNSQGSTAVYAGGSSTIIASPVAAVGNVPSSNNYAVGTTILPYTIAQPDPYSGLVMPTVPNGCNQALSVQPKDTKNVQNNNNGVQCYKGMDIKGTANLDPGTYIIDGSSGTGLNIGSQGTLNCTGCTFLLTSSGAASTIATLNMNGGSTVNITAPETGSYAGVVIFQDKNAILGSKNYITGNSSTGSSLLRGGIYMPGQELQLTGSSVMNTKCLQIVARQVTFTGNNAINNECPANSRSQAIAGTQIRLVN